MDPYVSDLSAIEDDSSPAQKPSKSPYADRAADVFMTGLMGKIALDQTSLASKLASSHPERLKYLAGAQRIFDPLPNTGWGKTKAIGGRSIMPAIAGLTSLQAQMEGYHQGKESMPAGGLIKAGGAAALGYANQRWLGGGLGPISAQITGAGKPGYRWWKPLADYDPEGDRQLRSWGLTDDPFGTRYLGEKAMDFALHSKDALDDPKVADDVLRSIQ